ncbi:MAG TPA: MMPL family transporter [Longimicrobiales bacterium]|nr:MMPL family transporter [Longimicrobiales bacterium]
MLERAWSSRLAPWVASGLAVLGAALVALFVDVSPQVEGDFFFAEDDPQMQASEAVAERFPSSPQIILRVEDAAGDTIAYATRVAALTEDLLAVEGITGGYSIATDDPSVSPLFSRILLTPDPSATNVILSTDRVTDPEILLPRLEEVVERHASPELAVVISGVPVIVELIRRSLYRDLVVFSLAAVLAFGLIIGVVYRDVAIVVGMLATCFVSVSLTLIVVQAIDVPIGLLTANLVTIVFVLTLSHVVFLTSNWRRAASASADRGIALLKGIQETLEGSFWSMATTLLGFLSLLIATARPLRDLGVAGAVGTVAAIMVAYTVYPAFLGRWAAPRPAREIAGSGRAVWGGRGALAVVGALVLVVGLGTLRVDTDPGLLTYFGEDTELREGLETIDRDGGSSTLEVVVRDDAGARVDTPPVFAEMQALQDALEADSAVGVVLSPTVLVGHARTLPLARLLPVATLLDIASSPQLDEVALGFVTADREEAHYSLRMRESLHDEPRSAVMERIAGYARDAGLEPVVIAGLYDLQAQLGSLIASSLRIGIGGLLLLFFGVALVVSRSPLIALKMWACLVGIPAVVLGTFGHLGIAIDIITSPAANVALAIGADSMLHLVVRVRRLAAAGDGEPWRRAVAQIGRPVLGATGIIVAGFGIFVLSSFPPTQRFGLAVIVGTATAAAMALFVLPRLVGRLAAEPAPAPDA